ncbi:MAG: glycogen synthase [Nocardiaceae bacterium]|nr:glycogen synthase [Nocardiaceae bacterium]
MRVAMLTREYPPHIYGGAGVHVAELVRHLHRLCDVDVHCIGEPREGAVSHTPDPELLAANPALQMMSAQVRMAAAVGAAEVAHSHTWYAGFAGHLAKNLYGIPHVVTAHSLEPRRPWKAEQLGGGYRLSSWSEHNAMANADAVIAVSSGMRNDVLDAYPDIDPGRVHVVRNGIDTALWKYTAEPSETLKNLGVDPTAPIVVFVGRITRQKGLAHLISAARWFDSGIQLVLCAGAPDTPEIAAEIGGSYSALSASRPGVFWIQQILPADEIRRILSAATAFVCPSVYEPLGIVNLEAMACNTAVIASDVGGIPEVVEHGDTGLLVHYDAEDAETYENHLAIAVNRLCGSPELSRLMGDSGRRRVAEKFAWTEVAAETVKIYSDVIAGR